MKKQKIANGSTINGTARSRLQRSSLHPATSSPVARFVMPSGNERKRITLIVTATLDHNIELFSLATGRMKTEIVVTALSEFLERHNIDPTQDRRTAVRDLLQVGSTRPASH